MYKFKICNMFVLLVLIVQMGCSNQAETTTKPMNSKDMKETKVTSILQEPISGQKNLVYCSTFQLAWNELKNGIIKEPIQLVNQPPEANYLNQGLVTKEDLATKDYVARAGYNKDNIVKQINEELKIKFGDEAKQLSERYQENDILAYAYLYKQLSFKYEFEVLEKGLDFLDNGKSTKVTGFGINHMPPREEFDKMAQQINIYDYQSPDDFVISLETVGEDQLILAKVQPEGTLMDTYRQVEKRLKRGPKQNLDYGDEFAIPSMNFKIEHNYNNLEKLPFVNKGFQVYQIDEAKQSIFFKLNEKGVTLESESLVGVKQSVQQSKSIVFDKPFLLYLKEEKAKYPYLILWINNPELLLEE